MKVHSNITYPTPENERKKMFLSVTKNRGSDAWQDTFLLKFQKEYDDFAPCPGEWLLHRGFKRGKMNTQTGESLLKHKDTLADEMAIKSEWNEPTKIMVTQEENYGKRELELIGKIVWLIDISSLIVI